MKRIIIFISLYLLAVSGVFAQSGTTVKLQTETGTLEGTLLIPNVRHPVPVALIIAGSGPTDRNGNNPMMINNSLKMLAEALYQNGIASLRYDKRGVAASKSAGMDESNLRFGFYIQDAIGWVNFLKQQKKFSEIVVIGHSQGSLIGMIASQQEGVAKYISLEGVGEPIDQLIRKQLKSQPAFVLEKSTPILDALSHGHTVDSVPPILNALFRPSVQPFLISWFHYHPQKEIAKLKIPVLIVQGTTDIQVSVSDAKNLDRANPKAKLVLIPGMNHILKDAPANRQQNIQTYTQPDLPINKELVKVVVDFIKN